MKRNWKKKLKALKREKKKASMKSNRASNRYWPAIFCTGENIFIGISHEPMSFKYGAPKYRVVDKHWQPHNCMFRSQEHIIDLSQYKVGDEVKCPKCGSKIDFRLWKSATKPYLVEVKKDERITEKIEEGHKGES